MLQTRKTGIENGSINVGSMDASYSDTVNGLTGRIDDLQDNITKFNNGDTSVTDHHSVSDKNQWVQERDELTDVRTNIQTIVQRISARQHLQPRKYRLKSTE